jgi:hypothetical protein
MATWNVTGWKGDTIGSAKGMAFGPFGVCKVLGTYRVDHRQSGYCVRARFYSFELAAGFARALAAIIKKRRKDGSPGPDWDFSSQPPTGSVLRAMRKDCEAAMSAALNF